MTSFSLPFAWRTLHVLPSLLMLTLSSPVANADASSLPLTAGQTFGKARAALLRAGWMPRRTHLMLADGTAENAWGTAKAFARRGYREVEICAGTGVSPCIFNYTNKHGRCLRVTTVGEQPAQATVSSWSFECPDADAR